MLRIKDKDNTFLALKELKMLRGERRQPQKSYKHSRKDVSFVGEDGLDLNTDFSLYALRSISLRLFVSPELYDSSKISYILEFQSCFIAVFV